MYIGVTLVFVDKEDKLISGILKSSVVEVERSTIERDIRKLGVEIATYYKYNFLGINDVFVVSGNVIEGEVLGRTTYYEIESNKKAQELKINFSNKISDDILKMFNCSLIFFCKTENKEKFAITILSILKTKESDIEIKAKEIFDSSIFKNKVKNISVDHLIQLDYIGIAGFEKIDLKYNVFETLYSEFEDLSILIDEVLTTSELNEMLIDIL